MANFSPSSQGSDSGLPDANEGQKAAPKRSRVPFAWVWVLYVLLSVGAVTGWFLWMLFGSRTYALAWSGGVQVEVLEEKVNTLETLRYRYTCSQNGSEIAPPQVYDEPSPVSQGDGGGSRYFFLRRLVGIHRPQGSGSPWVTWTPDDKSVTSWMEKFEAARRHVRKSSKEYFEEADYVIVNFKVQGRAWIIGLYDSNPLNEPSSDWRSGMPRYLHVESRDRGQTWKVKEPVSIPHWLIERSPRSSNAFPMR